MEKEIMDLFSKKFKEACEWRASDNDIEWKPSFRKDETGKTVTELLAYLNWAIVWRKMLEFYPDASYRVIETEEGSPLWNVNGYGMVRVIVTALGIERLEIYPVMQGSRNDSMKIEEIDGRDINDAIQRGLTKACARFGVGLYVYEGKLKAPKKKTETAYYKPKQQEVANKASNDKLHLIQTLMNAKKVSKDEIEDKCNIVLNSKTMTKEEADKVIEYLGGKETSSFGYTVEK